MLLVEVVAYSMVSVIMIIAGGSFFHLLFQYLIELNMARVARVEASDLDAQLRNMQEGNGY